MSEERAAAPLPAAADAVGQQEKEELHQSVDEGATVPAAAHHFDAEEGELPGEEGELPEEASGRGSDELRRGDDRGRCAVEVASTRSCIHAGRGLVIHNTRVQKKALPACPAGHPPLHQHHCPPPSRRRSRSGSPGDRSPGDRDGRPRSQEPSGSRDRRHDGSRGDSRSQSRDRRRDRSREGRRPDDRRERSRSRSPGRSRDERRPYDRCGGWGASAARPCHCALVSNITRPFGLRAQVRSRPS